MEPLLPADYLSSGATLNSCRGRGGGGGGGGGKVKFSTYICRRRKKIGEKKVVFQSGSTIFDAGLSRNDIPVIAWGNTLRDNFNLSLQMGYKGFK